jgi:hypothetical protein
MVASPTASIACGRRSARRMTLRTIRGLLVVAAGAVAARASAQTPTPTPQLRVHLSTNKGCLEFGDAAEFVIGEQLVAFLRVDSPTASQAAATLFALKDNSVTAIQLGEIPTNLPFALLARVGPPPGIHTLVLRASTDGVVSQRSCSFRVVDSGTRTPQPSRTMTLTPKPTRTATLTPTPTATSAVSATPTVTPNATLQPHLTTNRGCQETGQDPVFHLGELITVSFDVASGVVSHASAILDDILANGFVNEIPLGVLATNHPYSFDATIAPPSGVEKLQLRVHAFGASAASISCSFSVVP